MAQEFVHPNWHIILIHYPLGLVIVGTLIELFSFLWRRSGFRAAGRWMIAIGAVSLVPTALSGLYALADVVRMGTDGGEGSWQETMAASPLVQNADAWNMMIWHLRLQVGATLAVLAAVVLWIACSDRMRSRLHLLFLLMLLGGVGLMAAGAWYSGEAVYQHGVGVESQFRAHTPAVPGDGATRPATGSIADPADAEDLQTQSHRGITYFVPPLQLHLVLAGFAVGLALVSIGLSIRAMTAGEPTQVAVVATSMPAAPAAPVPPAPQTVSADAEREFLLSPEPPPARPAVVAPRIEQVLSSSVIDPARQVPSARFWLLSFLLAALASVGGWWVLAVEMETYDVNRLWNSVRHPVLPDGPEITRRLVHVVTGTAIVLLPLLLAMVARWAPRQKVLLALLTLILLAAVAAQVWFGVLLLYDTPVGPVTKFNP